MKLSVYSLNKTLFDDNIRQLTAKTAVGELTILDNHIPLLVPLVSGLLRIGLRPTRLAQEQKSAELTQGGVHAETTFPIQCGFLEVGPRGEVVVLADVTQSK